MIYAICCFLNSRVYWITISIVALGMMGIAIYYQYVLGEQPCQVCIHARLWVTAIILIGIIMSFFTNRNILLNYVLALREGISLKSLRKSLTISFLEVAL